MIKHIHILGASGSGTTTLGEKIQSELHFKHLDTDHYFWMPTTPPFTEKRDVSKRIDLIKNDINLHDRWVLTGSLCGWGDCFIDDFDLVIYLRIPKEVRMKRLELREKERNGDAILKGNARFEAYTTFMDWAASYDEGGLDIRSKALHYQWLDTLKCKVLKIEEDISLEQKMILVKKIINGECHGKE